MPLSTATVWTLATACGGGGILSDGWALSDANNYSLSTELDVQTLPLRALADIRVDWPDLTTDILGHPIEPADVQLLSVVVLDDLVPSEAIEALALDQVTQADVAVYMECVPTDQSCLLSEFSIYGSTTDLHDYFEEGSGSWLVTLGRGEEADIASMVFLEPSALATSEVASIGDDTSILTATVDLSSAVPLSLPADRAVAVDWSGLGTDGYGNQLQVHTLDRLRIARYEQSVAELEDAFLDLDLLAAERWTADVTGKEAFDLADLTGERAFAGLDADGTWLLALECTACFAPAPRLLTVLSPEP